MTPLSLSLSLSLTLPVFSKGGKKNEEERRTSKKARHLPLPGGISCNGPTTNQCTVDYFTGVDKVGSM